MSWGGFQTLSHLWLLTLLAPLVLLYFLKLKRPRAEIPSLALWRQVLQDHRVNSPFQRFKRNLLLLLQLLLLLFLMPIVGVLSSKVQAPYIIAFGWLALSAAMYYSTQYLDLQISFAPDFALQLHHLLELLLVE